MKLLLHACCGPCSLEPTRLLKAAGHDITIYYANSNIAPREEYEHRLTTLEKWAKAEGIPVIEGPYEPSTWEDTAGRIGDAALARVRAERAEAASREQASECGAAATEAAPGDGDAIAAGSLPGQTSPSNSPDLAPLRADVLSVDPAQREARCRACYRLRLEETAHVAAERGFEGIGTTLSVSPYQYTEVIREEVNRAAERAGLAGVFEDFRPYYDEATRRSRELGMYRQNFCGCRISDEEAAAERAERKAERAAKKAAERAAHADEIAAEEAMRAAHRAERAAYDKKQAKKRAILKALRAQAKEPEA